LPNSNLVASIKTNEKVKHYVGKNVDVYGDAVYNSSVSWGHRLTGLISQIKQDPKGICFSFENRKSKSLKLKVFLRQ